MPAQKSRHEKEGNPLTRLLDPHALRLIDAKGSALVEEVGAEVLRGVVLDVLTGVNLRDSTEVLTRRRIAALNMAMVSFFVRGASLSKDFIEQLPTLASRLLSEGGLSRSERWLAQWVLGLTDKAFQNVLRDDPAGLASYRERYIKACADVMRSHESTYRELSGVMRLGPRTRAEVNWLFMIYLLNTVGAQTLAIRGSEKSTYGKLFEKLVLGALLSVFGFDYRPDRKPATLRKEFWLSSRGERRESDATLLYAPGKGVRFDIGFIGRGNPEISLDKVGRFEHEVEFGGKRAYMATIIIVDRVGANSRIMELARKIGGVIVQMSASYWPQEVAKELNKALGFRHEILNVKTSELHAYLRAAMPKVPLEQFLKTT